MQRLPLLLVLTLLTIALLIPTVALADGGQQITLDTASIVTGGFSTVFAIIISILSYFLRGALNKNEEHGKDIAELKAALAVMNDRAAIKTDVRVLEEKMNGVAELKQSITQLREELLKNLASFREETMADAAAMRKDIKELSVERRQPRAAS